MLCFFQVLSFSLEAVPPCLHISNFSVLIFIRSLGASFQKENGNPQMKILRVLCQEAYKHIPVPILICLFLLVLLGRGP